MSSKSRIEWVDMAKGIGIILVMIGHLYTSQYTYMIIYAFHMPLFFFLAGYTFSIRKDFKDFIIGKLKTLLIPCLIFDVMIAAYNYYFMPGYHETAYLRYAFIGLFKQGRELTVWFSSFLFIMSIVAYFLFKYVTNVRYQIAIITIIYGIGMFYNMTINKMLWWNFDVLPMELPYFYVGYLLKTKYDDISKVMNKNLFMCSVVSLYPITLMSYVLSDYKVYKIYDRTYGFFPMNFLAAACGIYVVMYIASHIHFRFIKYIGVNSLIYYAIHKEIVYEVLYEELRKLGFEFFELNEGERFIYNVVVFMTTMLILTLTVWCYNKIKKKRKDS